jgi:predicted membrane-bound spermidine synthase
LAVLLQKSKATENVWSNPEESAFAWRSESWILPIMLISGFTTFSYEVLWTRLLSHILGGSIFAFAAMLASFLSGIAIGSMLASRVARTQSESQMGFIFCQLGIAITGIVIYLALDLYIPENAGLFGNVSRAIALLLPATVFIGATFPFAVRILCRNESEASIASARVYSWNTLGAIVGAVAAGFFIIPLLKYEGSIRLIVMVNVALALATAILLLPRRKPQAIGAGALLLALFLGFVPEAPESLLRVSSQNEPRNGTIRYSDVGRSATILMLERDGYFYLRSNGLSESSTDIKGAPPERNRQRLLATLPILARPDAETMMIIGLGGGVAAEAIPSSVAEIDIIELEPKVLEANRAIGPDRLIDPLRDERIEVIINDARNAMRLSDKKYDVIVSQPSHPWTAGASHLFTREFMQLAKSRLNTDGVFLQWMNTGFVSESLLKSLSATLLDVFPHVRAYLFDGTVLLFLASETAIEPETRILDDGEPLRSLGAEFKAKGIISVDDVLASLAWDLDGLKSFSGNAPLITDNYNLMAMQSVLALGQNSLTYPRLQQLILLHGSLYDSESIIHQQWAARIDFMRIATILDQNGLFDLSRGLANALSANRNSQSLLVRATSMQRQGQHSLAVPILISALESDPDNSLAAWLLFRNQGEAILNNTLPEDLQKHIGALTELVKAVITTTAYAKRGDRAPARANDALLSQAQPSDPWFFEASRSRADWRIVAARGGEPKELASEALEILDELITIQQGSQIYVMRMMAAYIIGDFPAVFETASRMVIQIRTGFEFRLALSGSNPTVAQVSDDINSLQSIQTIIKIIEDSGQIEAYKFTVLDENISEIRRRIETFAAQSAQ